MHMLSVPNLTRARTLLWAFSSVLVLLPLVGCEIDGTARSWYHEVRANFQPDPTHDQALAMVDTPYNADTRREGLVYLATGPTARWGESMRAYRTHLEDDADAMVRVTAARALGLHGRVNDAPRLAHALENDSDPDVRWEAALALQRLHVPESAIVGALQRAVQNDDAGRVRAAAARALGQYDRTAVFHSLVGALHDTDYAVVEAALDALETLTGQQIEPDIRAWLNFAEQHPGQLFAQRQQYTYEPYVETPGLMRRMTYWRGLEQDQPRIPRGMNADS